MILLFSAFTLLLAFAAIAAAGLAMLFTRRNSAVLRRLATERDAVAPTSDREVRALGALINDVDERVRKLESGTLLVHSPAARARATPQSPPLEDTATMEEPGPFRRGTAKSINYSRRTRALKLLRRGDTPEQVAAALEMPVSDVKLLAKLRVMLTGSQPQEGSILQSGDPPGKLRFARSPARLPGGDR